MKGAALKMATPRPRCLAENTSEIVPLHGHTVIESIPCADHASNDTNTYPAFVNGELPAVPAKNRKMINVQIF